MQINLHGVTKIEVSSLFLAPMDGFCRFSKWKTITIHCEDGAVKVNVFFSQDEHDSTIPIVESREDFLSFIEKE